MHFSLVFFKYTKLYCDIVPTASNIFDIYILSLDKLGLEYNEFSVSIVLLDKQMMNAQVLQKVNLLP